MIICIICPTSLFCEAKLKCQGQYFRAPDIQDSSLSITNSSRKFTQTLCEKVSEQLSYEIVGVDILYIRICVYSVAQATFELQKHSNKCIVFSPVCLCMYYSYYNT